MWNIAKSWSIIGRHHYRHSPHVGYTKAASLAKEAIKTGASARLDFADQLLTKEELMSFLIPMP